MRLRTVRGWLAIGCALVAMGVVVAARAQSSKPATPAKPHVETRAEQISKQLASVEPAEIDAAIAAMKQALTLTPDSAPGDRNAVHQCSTAFKDHWFARMLELKRYDDIEAVATLVIIEAARETPFIATVQKERVRAFGAAGKYDDALAAAKGYYNVCGLAQTGDAITLVATALVHARSEAGVARRFREQQAVGQKGEGGEGKGEKTAATQAAGAAGDLGTSILASIKIDGKPFDAAIGAIDTWNVSGMCAKANLLLICDRSKEARALTQEAYNAAASAAEINAATEGVARAMRAEDGNVARANAWLVSLQDKK